MAKVEIYTTIACPFAGSKFIVCKNIDFEKIDVTLSTANDRQCAFVQMAKHRFHKFLSIMIILAVAMIYSASIRQAI